MRVSATAERPQTGTGELHGPSRPVARRGSSRRSGTDPLVSGHARLFPPVGATPQLPDSGKKPPASQKQARTQQHENSAEHAAQQESAEDDAKHPDEFSHARFTRSFEGMPPLTSSEQPRRERAGSKPQGQRGRDQVLHPVLVTDRDDAVDKDRNEERSEHT